MAVDPALLAEMQKRKLVDPALVAEMQKRGIADSESNAPEQPTSSGGLWNSFTTGLGDPYHGAYQIGAHLAGFGDQADKQMAQREKDYEASDRGNSHPIFGIDWARGAGNAIGMIPAIVGGAAIAPEALTTGVVGAAAAGALGATMGAGVGVASKVVPKLANSAINLTKSAIGYTGDAAEAASQKLVQAFIDDGFSIPQAMERLKAWQESGSVPASLFDLGGDNVKKLVKASMTYAGEGRNNLVTALGERTGNQLDRVENAIGDNLSGRSYWGNLEDLTQAQKTKAAPLYDKAFSDFTPISNDTLTDLLKRPSMKAAARRAYSIAAEEGRNPEELGFNFFDDKMDPHFGNGRFSLDDASGPNKFLNELSPKIPYDKDLFINRQRQRFSANDPIGTPNGADLEKANLVKPGEIDAARVGDLVEHDPIFAKAPTIQTWDYVKRGLDDMINGLPRDSFNRPIMDERYRAIDATRRALLGTLKEENPTYANALNAYAGPAASKDALNLGRQFLTKDASITQKTLADMSDSDKEFFKAGVAQKLREIAEATPDGADIAKRLFATEAKRNRLDAAFDNHKEFQAFTKQMEQEIEAYSNARAVNANLGSQTGTLAADRQDLNNSIANAAITNAPTLLHSPLAYVGKLAGAAVDSAKGIPTKAAANEITSRASQIGNDQTLKNLNILRQAQVQMADDQAKRAARQQALNDWLTRSLNVTNPSMYENRHQ